MRSRRGRHLIAALDGDRAVLTVARVTRRAFAVEENVRFDGAGDAASLMRALDTLRLEGLDLPVRLHLLLSGGNLPRFTMRLPRLKASEMEVVLERKGRQEAGLSLDAAIRVVAVPGARGSDGLRAYRCTGFPEARLGIARALHERPDVHLETVGAIEDAALEALPASMPTHVVLLDRNRSGVRIAYLTEGRLVHERQVLFDAAQGGDGVLSRERLKFELARTLDYFAGEGSPAPAGIAFAPGLGVSAEDASLVTDALPVVPLDLPEVPPTRDPVALASLGWLRALSGRSQVPWLDYGAPGGQRLTVAARVGAAALLAGAGVTWMHVGAPEAELAAARAEVAKRIEVLEAAVAERDAAVEEAPPAPEPPGGDRLAEALGQRRPASALLAALLEATPGDLALLEAGYDTFDRIRVAGRAERGSRIEAMRALRTLEDAIDALPYVVEVDTRVTYPQPTEEDPGRMTFVIWARFGETS